MRQKPKKLLIVTLTKSVHIFLCDLVKSIFNSQVDVYGCCVSDDFNNFPDPDVILLGGGFLEKSVARIFKEKQIIIPKKILTGNNLEKLLLIPEGKRVLIASSHTNAALDIIEGLKTIGINHINYTPYPTDEIIDFSQYYAAATPNQNKFAPKEIKNVIDIGPRYLSIITFIEITNYLNLSLRFVETYSNYYIRNIFSAARKLTEANIRIQFKEKQEQLMLNEFDDGMLLIDIDGNIIMANQNAKLLLELENDNIIGKSCSDIFKNFKKISDINEGKIKSNRTSSIYRFHDKNIICTNIISSIDDINNTIIILREINSIQTFEANIRKGLNKKGFIAKYTFNDLLSRNDKFLGIIAQVKEFSSSTHPILLEGESGTGKELFAHAIHNNSPRREGPFVAVNFAGIPETLMESELFGYEDGAFTGAVKGGKKGLFEQAHGGTIFLDEIGDAPLSLQARLLRVLQEKEIMKLGATQVFPIDVRVVAATNTHMREAVKSGMFRTDLYYRLNTLSVHIPPLRDRKEDIELILNNQFQKENIRPKKLHPETLTILLNHKWPGNIRELVNISEYLHFSTKKEKIISPEYLPPYLNEAAFSSSKQNKDQDHKATTHSLDNSSHSLILSCLSILDKHKSPGVGRTFLHEQLEAMGVPSSPARVRKVLTLMRSMGLVYIGTTKQGTHITAAGRLFLCDNS